jgi:hypothetical protein
MNEGIKWLGTLTSIIGSFLVANRVFLLGYTLFLIGSISWLVIGIKSKDKPLVLLNGVFFTANIMGFYNAWN